jgi:hypothetical protein
LACHKSKTLGRPHLRLNHPYDHQSLAVVAPECRVAVELQGSVCVALLLFSLLLSPSLFPPHPLQILRMDSCPPVAILVRSDHMWGRSCSSMLMAWCSKLWSQHLAPPCRGECMYSRPQGTPVFGATQPSLPPILSPKQHRCRSLPPPHPLSLCFVFGHHLLPPQPSSTSLLQDSSCPTVDLKG